MAPAKDRLTDLKKLQKNNEEETNGSNYKQDVELSKETIKFLESAENIRQDFDAMKGNTKRITELLDQYKVYPTRELQAQLHSMLSASSTINFTVHNKLKNLEKEIVKIKKPEASESRIKKLQYVSLKQEFQELLQSNNNIIESYRDEFKTQLKTSAKIVRNLDDDEVEALLEDDKPIQVFIDNILDDTRIARQQLEDLETRHKELLYIENQLKDVAVLFKQIAILVEQQQESIDRVEHHAQTATDFIEQGAVDIGKSHRRKRKYSKMKIYLAIFLTVLTLIVIMSFLI